MPTITAKPVETRARLWTPAANGVMMGHMRVHKTPKQRKFQPLQPPKELVKLFPVLKDFKAPGLPPGVAAGLLSELNAERQK